MNHKKIKQMAMIKMLKNFCKIITCSALCFSLLIAAIFIFMMTPIGFFEIIDKPIVASPVFENIQNGVWLISNSDLTMIYIFFTFILVLIVCGCILIKHVYDNTIEKLENENKDKLLLENIKDASELDKIVDELINTLKKDVIHPSSAAPVMIQNAIYLELQKLPKEHMYHKLNRIQTEYINDKAYKYYMAMPGNDVMHPYTDDLKEIIDNTPDIKKIRLFYELAKYINKNVDDDELENDPKMQKIYAEIKNLITAIEAL